MLSVAQQQQTLLSAKESASWAELLGVASLDSPAFVCRNGEAGSSLSHGVLRSFCDYFPTLLHHVLAEEEEKERANPSFSQTEKRTLRGGKVVCGVVTGGSPETAVLFLSAIHSFTYAPISSSLPLQKLKWEISDVCGDVIVVHAPPLGTAVSCDECGQEEGNDLPNPRWGRNGVSDVELARVIVVAHLLGLPLLFMQTVTSPKSRTALSIQKNQDHRCWETFAICNGCGRATGENTPIGLFTLRSLHSLRGNTSLLSRLCTALPSEATLFRRIFQRPPLSPRSHSLNYVHQVVRLPHDTVLLVHTSGTTSKPKIVGRTASGIIAGALTIARTLGLQPSDLCLNVLPLYHMHGLMVNILATVVAGARVVCHPRFNALNFLSEIFSSGVTWYSAVPTIHQLVLIELEGLLKTQKSDLIDKKENLKPKGEEREENMVIPIIVECLCKSAWTHHPAPMVCCCKKRTFPSLRFIRNCSAHLPVSVAERLEGLLHCIVLTTYAMSEAIPICSNPLVRDRTPPSIPLALPSCQCQPFSSSSSCDPPMIRNLGSVGPPGGPFVRVAPQDCSNKEGENEGNVGEVQVQGICVIDHYFSSSTSSTLASGFTEDGWLKTGDLGFIDDQNRLHLIGRAKELIVQGGEKESAVLIESAAVECIPATDLMVFACPHLLLGQVVGLAIVPQILPEDNFIKEEEEGDKVGEQRNRELRMTLLQIQALMRYSGKVEEKWLPRLVVYVPHLPLTHSGKKKRIAFGEDLGLPKLGEKGCVEKCAWEGFWDAEKGWCVLPFPRERREEKGEDAEIVVKKSQEEGRENEKESKTEKENGEIGIESEEGLSLPHVRQLIVDILSSILPSHLISSLSSPSSSSSSSSFSPSPSPSPSSTFELFDNRTFLDLGLDSMGEIVFAKRLSQHLGVKVKTSLFVRYNSLQSLALHLHQRHVTVHTKQRRKEKAKRKAEEIGGGKKEKKRKTEDDLKKVDSEEIFSVAKRGDLSRMKEILSQFKEHSLLGEIRDRYDNNALHWAAGENQVAMVRFLIETGSVRVDDNGTPSFQCEKGEKRREGENETERGGGARTALMWACRNGHLETAQILVKLGANPKAMTKKGVQPIHWAVWGGSISVVKWLYSSLAISLDTLSFAGCNTAIWAAAAGNIDMCRFLFENGASFTLLNYWGHGVLVKAVWKGHLDLLSYLLSLDGVGKQLFLLNPVGESPLDLARMTRRENVVSFLERAMFDFFDPSSESFDVEEWRKAFHCKRGEGNKKIQKEKKMEDERQRKLKFLPAPVSLVRIHQHKLEEIEGRVSERSQLNLL